MSAYGTCPCGGAVLISSTKGTTRVFCKHCRKWVRVKDGIVYGYV